MRSSANFSTWAWNSDHPANAPAKTDDTASAMKELQGKLPDEIVLLTLRTNVVLTTEEIALLTTWNARLLYDNGNMATGISAFATGPCFRKGLMVLEPLADRQAHFICMNLTVAIRTQGNAFLNFFQNANPRVAPLHHLTNVRFFVLILVVKI